ncbi:hypothetical protein CR513_23042, partial [Mucuna pruriens]
MKTLTLDELLRNLRVHEEDLDSSSSLEDDEHANICLMVDKTTETSKISLVGERRTSYWFLDNGCSHHMMGNMSMFLDFKQHEGTISFGGNVIGKIVGIGKVGKHSLPTIENILYIDGLKYNPLSINQFRDNRYVISFNKDTCIVKNKDDIILFTIQRHEYLYMINLDELNNKKVTCLMSKDDERWIWHKKLGHINLKHISKFYKKHLIKGLLKISWKTHFIYDTC